MFEKLLNVLSKNLGYTVVLALSIVLFAIFSDGLVSGLITAVSALLVYTCITALYHEYTKTPVKQSAPVKKASSKSKKKK